MPTLEDLITRLNARLELVAVLASELDWQGIDEHDGEESDTAARQNAEELLESTIQAAQTDVKHIWDLPHTVLRTEMPTRGKRTRTSKKGVAR